MFEIFAKRKKKQEHAGKPDVYQYTELRLTFRRQVVLLWIDCIGKGFNASAIYNKIFDTMIRELGVFSLGKPHNDSFEQCQEYLLNTETDNALSIIELSFLCVSAYHQGNNFHYLRQIGVKTTARDGIEELNYRFRESGIGYQYVDGQIVRVDSQYIHAEAILPALSLLDEQAFRGASDEFMKAHDHYRHGRFKESISEALKSFESTLKSICDKRQWNYPATATAKPLIDLVIQNGLIPPFLEQTLTGLRSALEGGLPTLRNKISGHGQGTQAKAVPSYLAAYAIHIAASNITMLVEAHKSNSQT